MTNIRLTIIGSGSMVPTKERNPAGFLLEIDNRKILLDCGHGTIRRLVDYGFNLQDIDLVFISHFHTDHFADAFSLIHSRFVDDLYNKRKHKKILYLGPKNTSSNFKSWRKIFWPEPNEQYPVKFKEGANRLTFGNIQIETFVVKHVNWFQSIGIVIKYINKKLVYTGDIGSDHNFDDLIKTVSNSDLLITEASYEKPTPNHFTVEQVKKLKLKANVKKVLIFHLRPQTEKRTKHLLSRQKDIIIKKDGETLII